MSRPRRGAGAARYTREELEAFRDHEAVARVMLERAACQGAPAAWLTDPDEARRHLATVAFEAADTVEDVERAVERAGPAAWEAVRHALWCGWALGQRDACRREGAALHAAEVRAPHTARGVRVVRAAREGGRTRRRAPSDDVLAADVAALHERCPRMSWRVVCTRVGKAHGLSGRTVQRRARAADWRPIER